MVHLVSAMLFTLDWNEPPRSALSFGGIYRWKDGRDMPDLQTVLFDYHGIPVYIRLGLSTETPERARYMGPKGLLDTTGVRYPVFSAEGNRYRTELLRQQFPSENARRVCS